jgi:hypothetical protein
MEGAQPPETAARRVNSWWAAVLAGLVDEPHPLHGNDVDVSFKGGVLQLSGELESEDDRREIVREAREFVGRGVDSVDAKHLTVARRKEKAGILDQTLIAAFPNRDVAEYARTYLVDSRRIGAKKVVILDSGKEGKAQQLLPAGFVNEVQKAFKAGEAVLILRVDETSAFKVRELLAQETRSLWTVAAPPEPTRGEAP